MAGLFRIADVIRAGLFFGLSVSAAFADELIFLGSFDWHSERVAGLSGLEVAAGGERFTAVADRGWFVEGSFTRDVDQITGVEIMDIHPIRDEQGLPVTARRVGDQSDAEGLAISPDGEIHVSFERWAHVSSYDGPEAAARYAPDHPDFREMSDNRQLEALAQRSDGALFVFPEKAQGGGFKAYRLGTKGWVVDGSIQASDGFSLVGADFDDEDRLYILERKLVLGVWWQSRIRRIDLAEGGAGEVLWSNARGAFGNLEGIGLWYDDQGLRVTLVSDNNAKEGVATQFLEFRLAQ